MQTLWREVTRARWALLYRPFLSDSPSRRHISFVSGKYLGEGRGPPVGGQPPDHPEVAAWRRESSRGRGAS